MSGVSFANDLPPLPGKTSTSPHKLFISSESYQTDSFDVWNIDGGYAYELFDSVDLYVGARVNNSPTQNQSGFLSGISYHFNDRVTVKSTVRSYKSENSNGIQTEDSSLAAELSSRVKITDKLDIHATLDYQDWQQGFEVGLGFRF
ncbi:ribonuclease regulator [Vibrio parahaemolyticus]|uniref:ribonuclease regulator n=1 Tax=Vibrio parahaemolyticus TaxID=670 RepID=UPI001120ABDE|nr:ribonuclease regulator [Vibrio parahaemolyticus]TNZ19167.1 ribonuclease regulator [Vibrio parahaemolyticus]TOE93956.1 ribonuclease regulator [Vibrio parahaemolyticus]TOM80337.1 ribonuclease regulator [Vibrio parahaemolyticus]TON46525.1 ribonuclease regulator [Vibrio parahaemolyticus]TON80586.1 ribonuclease regulator [Vibrio parahaemolyticus]